MASVWAPFWQVASAGGMSQQTENMAGVGNLGPPKTRYDASLERANGKLPIVPKTCNKLQVVPLNVGGRLGVLGL